MIWYFDKFPSLSTDTCNFFTRITRFTRFISFTKSSVLPVPPKSSVPPESPDSPTLGGSPISLQWKKYLLQKLLSRVQYFGAFCLLHKKIIWLLQCIAFKWFWLSPLRLTWRFSKLMNFCKSTVGQTQIWPHPSFDQRPMISIYNVRNFATFNSFPIVLALHTARHSCIYRDNMYS